jgi:hypothetical protein
LLGSIPAGAFPAPGGHHHGCDARHAAFAPIFRLGFSAFRRGKEI